jgi:cytochrome c peroxidase
MPEVPNNIDMTVGNLGLTDREENQIVVFLHTLTDGFTTPYPDINTFTGQCVTGGTAATQGNEFLIPRLSLRASAGRTRCGGASVPSHCKGPARFRI